MSATTVAANCSCDTDLPPPPVSLPGLPLISCRDGTFRELRRELLTPLPNEPALTAWHSSIDADPVISDLAVMMVEWWAYLADILTFYNERIANEDYLRTAQLPETPGRLVSLLGYRPRPAIGATGTLAALVTLGQTATLPKGLQFQSKPGPGQTPQTFELGGPTTIGAPDVLTANPYPPNLVAKTGSGYIWQHGYPNYISRGVPLAFLTGAIQASAGLSTAKFSGNLNIGAIETASGGEKKVELVESKNLDLQNLGAVESSVEQAINAGILQLVTAGGTPAPAPEPGNFQVLLTGSVTKPGNGAMLLLGQRDDTAQPTLITLSSPPDVRIVTGGKQTALSFTVAAPGAVPVMSLAAVNARLQSSGQTMGAWSVNTGAFQTSASTLQLAGLARQIHAGDWVVLTAPNAVATEPNFVQVVQVASTADVLGDASKGSGGSATNVSLGGAGNPIPIPVLHTALTLPALAPLAWPNQPPNILDQASNISVLFGWVEVGALVDQPPQPWDGTDTTLAVVQPGVFPTANGAAVLIQDSIGRGVQAVATSGGGSQTTIGFPPAVSLPLSPPTQPSLQIFYNLLPVSRGKTVANEILGSGDATIAGQSFMLQQSPVTYLPNGATYASTIVLTVNGVSWKEVPFFYGQGPAAQIFVTREDDQNNTHVDFGDGVNGARLPTGTSNVVATYRIGAGSGAPAAGKLTVISQAWPGLRAIVNPVAVSGGSDPDSASLLQQFAPRSVLTFGRAVSIADYQAIAAQVGGVTRASTVWSWNPNNQRAGVTVYVAGTGDVRTPTIAALGQAGDPNRPVTVTNATPITVTLVLTLIVTPGLDPTAISTAVTAALADPSTGLFAPARLNISQTVFDSQIEAACQSVAGVVAVTMSTFYANGTVDPGPLHVPGEGAFYDLEPDAVSPTAQADPNG